MSRGSSSRPASRPLCGLAVTGDGPEGVRVMPVAEIFARAGAGGWEELRRRYDAG